MLFLNSAKFKRAGLVAVCLLSPFPVLASGSLTGPEFSFHPSTSWTLQPDAAGGRCVIASEFDNGFIMRLQASVSSLESLELDLRQTVFDAGMVVDVSASVPGVFRQALKGSARTSGVLNVDLSGHSRLYDSMKAAGVVDLNVVGNEFRFYLTGFSAASSRLESCVSGADALVAVDPHVPQDIAPTWAGPSVEHARGVSEGYVEAQEKSGRALPPPTGSLDVPSEWEERAAAARISAQQDDDYSRELMQMMPEEKDYIVPIQEILPEDRAMQVREVSRPKSVAPRPARRQRLTEMLVDEMQRRHEEMQKEGDYVHTYRETVITSPPLKAPLVQKGSAAEKALAEILMGKPVATAPGEASGSQEIEVKKDVEERDDVSSVGGERFEQNFQPKIRKSVRRMEVDVTDVARPSVPEPRKRSGENWVDVFDGLEKDDVSVDPPVRDSLAGLTPELSEAKRSSFDSGRDMEARIRALETQLSAIAKENTALEDELQFALEQSQQETIAIASDNWNLEKSTKRYHEAKRQIDRLGQELRKERAQCSAEKKELETMLFDPQLTEQSQLAKLAQMEDQLKKAERDLVEQRQVYEGRIQLLQDKIGR